MVVIQKYRKFICNKVFLGTLLVIGLIYVVFFCFLENPLLEENTASLVGVRHPVLFLIWNILTCTAFFFNSRAMYKTYGCTNKLGRAAIWIALFAVPVLYFVNGDLVDGEIVLNGTTKAIHWVAAIAFIVCNAAAIGFLFIHARKTVKRFNFLCLFTCLIVVGMLIVFFTIGKSGLFEALPIFMVYIMLFFVNCTNLFLPAEEKFNKK